MHLTRNLLASATPWHRAAMGLALFAAACTDPLDAGEDHSHEETEAITTVTLTFTPDGGGEAITASFRDPDGDGGMSGSSDPVTLAADTSYTLTVTLLDELEDSPEDITTEIQSEAEEHQLLFFGSAVAGPATEATDALLTHAYDDVESDYGADTQGDDLPVGLRNTIATGAAGSGELQVMLRHLPELNGEPQKTADLANAFATNPADVPGETDANVRFDVTVQ